MHSIALERVGRALAARDGTSGSLGKKVGYALIAILLLLLLLPTMAMSLPGLIGKTEQINSFSIENSVVYQETEKSFIAYYREIEDRYEKRRSQVRKANAYTEVIEDEEGRKKTVTRYPEVTLNLQVENIPMSYVFAYIVTQHVDLQNTRGTDKWEYDHKEIQKFLMPLMGFEETVKKESREHIYLEVVGTLAAPEEVARTWFKEEEAQMFLFSLETFDGSLGFTENGDSGVVVNLEGVTLTEITKYACQYVGNPYKYGGENINTGIDCSAYVRYVYAHFGVSLPRTSREQVKTGKEVRNLEEAEPGDLIFYSKNGTDSGVYHVTMYLGNGKMVHASNSKPYPEGGIKVSSVYGKPYRIKRIVQ